MLVINCNTEIYDKISIYDKMFLYYRNNIVNLFNCQWKEEDINGTSCVQLISTKYFLSFLYILLLYSEQKESYKTDLELIEKYEITKMKECFGCEGISIKKLLELAEITLTPEPPSTSLSEETSSVSLDDILALNNTKIILLQSNC